MVPFSIIFVGEFCVTIYSFNTRCWCKYADLFDARKFSWNQSIKFILVISLAFISSTMLGVMPLTLASYRF